MEEWFNRRASRLCNRQLLSSHTRATTCVMQTPSQRRAQSQGHQMSRARHITQQTGLYRKAAPRAPGSTPPSVLARPAGGNRCTPFRPLASPAQSLPLHRAPRSHSAPPRSHSAPPRSHSAPPRAAHLKRLPARVHLPAGPDMDSPPRRTRLARELVPPASLHGHEFLGCSGRDTGACVAILSTEPLVVAFNNVLSEEEIDNFG
jgi:hypothetical protein